MNKFLKGFFSLNKLSLVTSIATLIFAAPILLADEISVRDVTYSYSAEKNAGPADGVRWVLEAVDKKRGEVVYRETGLPPGKPCKVFGHLLSSINSEKRYNAKKVKNLDVIFACASEGGGRTVISAFVAGSISARISLDSEPFEFKMNDEGVFYIAAHQKYYLPIGSSADFLYVFKFDPWSQDQFGFFPANDSVSSGLYKNEARAVLAELKAGAIKYPFAAGPLFAALSNVDDRNFQCEILNEVNKVVSSGEVSIESVMEANRSYGFHGFDVNSCGSKKIR